MFTMSQPTHPDRLEVIKGDQPYSSSAKSLISLPAGALFAKMASATVTEQHTYTSVATGISSRIELNSDLVFCNHSCDPSLVFDITQLEVRVVDKRPLQVGDDLTFFYPSSEWDMVQPFQCGCGAGPNKCLGYISGAKHIHAELLNRYWLNDHVRDLMDEREKKQEVSRPAVAVAVSS
ncbi:hypothetical protein BPAE_0534g00010 [Botrytis paeoniae]|uniref:SET domain-containing protein n=1 Tax=Botrytis paeoniae TaxID=278948 RepID=A0A4Z1F437_9HELO|nr:hypothetical protein BPAE_0534g00010 [Botrytis paeoniae]